MKEPLRALCLILLAASLAFGCSRGAASPIPSAPDVDGPGETIPEDAAPLGPAAAEPVQKAFARMRPALRWTELQVGPVHVRGRLCSEAPGSGDCFDIDVGPERRHCPTDVSASLCVTFPKETPSAAAIEVVRAALGKDDLDGLWPQKSNARRLWRLATDANFVPLAVVAVPILVGLLAGLACRRALGGRLRHRVWFWSGFALPPLACVALAGIWPVTTMWDALLEGGIAGLSFVMSAHAVFADRGSRWATVASIGVSLILLELACRVALPPAPGFPQVQPTLFRARSRSVARSIPSHEFVCSVAYPGAYPAPLDTLWGRLPRPEELSEPSARARRVLHVGDSMVLGRPPSPPETFVGRLRSMEPDTDHINAAIGATAPDDHYAVMRRWMGHHHFGEVVVYLYAGNDLEELDAPHRCSANQPLVAYSGGKAALRFPSGPRVIVDTSRWPFDPGPPYLMRYLVHASAAAAYGSAALDLLANHGNGEHQPAGVALEHLRAILTTIRDELAAQHTRLVVVVIPIRAAVEGRQDPTVARSLLQVARDLGLDALDAYPPLRDAYVAGESLFLENNDIHLAARGHSVMADWLHSALPR